MDLSPNSLAFIALSNEYCFAVENIGQSDSSSAFVAAMVRILPRIYIAASDLRQERDVFLEVFEEDMKYSETPIGMSLSEGLSDIFQVLYNFIATVKDAPSETVNAALVAIKDDFGAYWSQRLCNLMRPLNYLYFNSSDDGEVEQFNN